MLKRIGLSAAALIAALVVFVQPPNASAQSRDSNGRNNYNNNQQNSYGQSNGQWNTYGSSDRSQNSYIYNRQPNGYVNAREQNTRVSQQSYEHTDRNPRLSGNGWSAQGWRDRDSLHYRRSEDSDGYNSDRR